MQGKMLNQEKGAKQLRTLAPKAHVSGCTDSGPRISFLPPPPGGLCSRQLGQTAPVHCTAYDRSPLRGGTHTGTRGLRVWRHVGMTRITHSRSQSRATHSEREKAPKHTNRDRDRKHTNTQSLSLCPARCHRDEHSRSNEHPCVQPKGGDYVRSIWGDGGGVGLAFGLVFGLAFHIPISILPSPFLSPFLFPLAQQRVQARSIGHVRASRCARGPAFVALCPLRTHCTFRFLTSSDRFSLSLSTFLCACTQQPGSHGCLPVLPRGKRLWRQ